MIHPQSPAERRPWLLTLVGLLALGACGDDRGTSDGATSSSTTGSATDSTTNTSRPTTGVTAGDSDDDTMGGSQGGTLGTTGELTASTTDATEPTTAEPTTAEPTTAEPQAVCGDGVVAGDEACDDGNRDDTDACTTLCEAAECGDGHVWADVEACDDGNRDDTDACTSVCVAAACGDGVMQVDEMCDDGNIDGTDSCTSVCAEAVCGDGFVRAGVEDCDDGDGLDNGCTTQCTEQRVLDVVLGFYHACAVLTGGRVKCWGGNGRGQLGLGDLAPRGAMPGQMGAALPAVDFGPGITAVALSASAAENCAVLSDGQLLCWGENNYGQLGQGNQGPANLGDAPGELAGVARIDLGMGEKAVDSTVGLAHACALLASGNIKCWGYNGIGALGLGDTVDRGGAPGQMGDNLPAVALGANKTAAQVEAGRFHTCARLTDGTSSAGATTFTDSSASATLPNAASHRVRWATCCRPSTSAPAPPRS